ncbi:hypothetical protein [Thermosulfurimonas sp. F29]|uniref:hypothetical protein n=1 Tax=Thermosulfurimonas sp. F29 TaxID=2867247 RepID=UPI001C82DE5B|nr:hypothetical protein [Thermosulfurimonas sp. F29]MBX6424133.1 hypothetical protein [Thermosulfurimonas sp. F29]
MSKAREVVNFAFFQRAFPIHENGRKVMLNQKIKNIFTATGIIFLAILSGWGIIHGIEEEKLANSYRAIYPKIFSTFAERIKKLAKKSQAIYCGEAFTRLRPKFVKMRIDGFSNVLLLDDKGQWHYIEDCLFVKTVEKGQWRILSVDGKIIIANKRILAERLAIKYLLNTGIFGSSDTVELRKECFSSASVFQALAELKNQDPEQLVSCHLSVEHTYLYMDTKGRIIPPATIFKVLSGTKGEDLEGPYHGTQGTT